MYNSVSNFDYSLSYVISRLKFKNYIIENNLIYYTIVDLDSMKYEYIKLLFIKFKECITCCLVYYENDKFIKYIDKGDKDCNLILFNKFNNYIKSQTCVDCLLTFKYATFTYQIKINLKKK
jgi:hypothetical protein